MTLVCSGRYLVLAALTLCVPGSLVLSTLTTTITPTFAGESVSSPTADAVSLIFKGDFIQAGEAARRSGDPAAMKLVELMYLRDKPNEAGYRRIMSFLDTAPDWPLADALLKRAERSLYVNSEAADTVLAHFRKREPTTAQGALAYARALISAGQKSTALNYIRIAYLNTDISLDVETQILTEYGDMIGSEDHRNRMWRLIYAQDSDRAMRTSKRLSADYQRAAVVAQQLLKLTPGADKGVASLPSAMQREAALKYALVRYYRNAKDYKKASAILATVPGDAKTMGDPTAWWRERRVVARYWLGRSYREEVRVAYQIARAHGLSKGDEALEAEFLAGWIAFRYLNEPATGLKHFERLEEIAESRSEKARAAYWSGRTLEAMGRKAKAKARYKVASQYTTVYYGQLAREKIGLGMVPETIPAGDASTSARTAVEKDEAVRAFRLLAAAGRMDELQMFITSFANRFKTVDEMNAAASVVWSVGGAQMSVRLAKAAAARNVDIDAWSYPVRALPEWRKIGKPVEAPLVYALARQESEFNPRAGSRVGAQGLMQIMPGTAQLITKQYKLRYRDGMLTEDPAFNVMLGAAHLGDLINNHGGSYILALVSYNAGPRRSREWIAEYGDFRRGEIDPVDWVESIPFQETRQYVQKVMQNLHIYRSRLAPKTVQPMTADLARGALVDTMIVSTVGAAEPDNTKCAGNSIVRLALCN